MAGLEGDGKIKRSETGQEPTFEDLLEERLSTLGLTPYSAEEMEGLREVPEFFLIWPPVEGSQQISTTVEGRPAIQDRGDVQPSVTADAARRPLEAETFATVSAMVATQQLYDPVLDTTKLSKGEPNGPEAARREEREGRGATDHPLPGEQPGGAEGGRGAAEAPAESPRAPKAESDRVLEAARET